MTIATDLGDRFFPGRITLSAGLFPPDGRCMVSSNRFVWEQGMRCLWIEIRLHKIQHLEWPMQMNVSHMAGGIVHNALSLDSVPWIVDACSHFVHSDVKADISKQIVRAFTLSPGRLLYMHEDTGDSMSRHIW